MQTALERGSLADMTPPGEDELAAQYEQMVHAVAWGFQIPHLDHADVCQEARIALLKAIRNFRGGSSLHGYVRQSMVNHLMNVRRGAMQGRRYTSDTMLEIWEHGEYAPTSGDADPEAAYDFKIRFRMIMGRMRNLPGIQREALVLVLNGYSYAEVASQLGTTVPAVKSLIVRARRTLETV